MEALRLYTVGSAWFSTEENKKGSISQGALADLAVLSDDYFEIPEEKIKDLVSVLTIVGGKPVYGAAEFKNLAPPALPILPEWSPVTKFGGYALPPVHAHQQSAACTVGASKHHHEPKTLSESQVLKILSRQPWGRSGLWGAGCDCFAF
jgi:hypothetical protein